MVLEDKKVRYAELRAQGIEPYPAARQIYNNEALQGYALKISQEWEQDEYVVRHLKELKKKSNPEDELLSKTELCKNIEESIQSCYDVDAKIKLLDLYVTIRGFKTKPQESGSTTNVQNNIMLVHSSNSDDEWEKRMQQQQARLVEEG